MQSIRLAYPAPFCLYQDRKIYQIDPQTGAILRTIESTRFVARVTWIDGELWHGTWKVTRAI